MRITIPDRRNWFCSFVVKDQLCFGGYPNRTEFHHLVENGFRFFIDLTTPIERDRLSFRYDSPSFLSHIRYHNYPIRDNGVPENPVSFLQLARESITALGQGTKIYIHCKGGHGRSGILVATILILLYDVSPYHAIRITTEAHEKRPNLKAKWKGISCPQMAIQKSFVHHLFLPQSIPF